MRCDLTGRVSRPEACSVRAAWGYLTRAGFEADLVAELAEDAEVVAPGVVAASARKLRTGLEAPFFARQAMRKPQPVQAWPEAVQDGLTRVLSTERPFEGCLQVVAPDSGDPEDPRRPLAEELQQRMRGWDWTSAARHGGSHQEVLVSEARRWVQVWVISTETVWVGITEARDVLSPQPAGRTKLRRPADAVSRAGLKLEEAIHWVGVGPERGETVADLGAAPGGWTQVLLGRGARVVAVDPKTLKVTAPAGRLEHLRESAFDYAPPDTLDWVVCDMAWRPAEVARLIAKWGRRGWARQFVANFKLPMRKKVQQLEEVVAILKEGGWTGLRGRHLFHDRDEVTVYGWLSAAQARRPARAPFEVRAKKKHESTPRSLAKPRKTSAGAAKKRRPRKTSVKRRAAETPKKGR